METALGVLGAKLEERSSQQLAVREEPLREYAASEESEGGAEPPEDDGSGDATGGGRTLRR